MVNLREYGEIYCLTSPSGKQYIGQCVILDSNRMSNGTKRRWKSHVREANKYKHKGSWLLNNAIRKYDENNFKVESLISCHVSKLNYYEKLFIKGYNTLKPNGYNLVAGGNSSLTNLGKKYMARTSIEIQTYIMYYECNGSTGYRVCHPDLPSKGFISALYTMEEKLEMAQKYIETGKCHDGLLPRLRKNEEENSFPKYVKSKRGGYVVESPERGYKTFTNQNYTQEENLAMAIEFLETGEFTPPREWHVRKDEKDSELPKYICRYRNGFQVQYYLGNHKKIRKTFLSKNMTDEEKINLAKIYLDDLINGTHNYKEPEKIYFKKSNLPKYIGYSSSGRGYMVTHHPTKTNKSFASLEFTQEENLQRAIDFVNQLNNIKK